MRITYRTLAALIERMDENQKDSDVTVEVEDSECFSAELRIADEEHDGGLDDNHPVLFVNFGGDHDRNNNVDWITNFIGLKHENCLIQTGNRDRNQ